MLNNKFDWLGICLDMVSEYMPAKVSSKAESRKYWEINEHLVCLLEFSGLTSRPGTSPRADYLNDFLKDFIRIFNQQIENSAKSELDGENNFDNAALNNWLLLSLIVNSEETPAMKKQN